MYPDALKFLVQRDQQNDARNQDNKRDKKMAVRENGFRGVGKSQSNLQGQISFALPSMLRCVLERGNHYSDDVTSIIMFDGKTGKSQAIAKGAYYRDADL